MVVVGHGEFAFYFAIDFTFVLISFWNGFHFKLNIIFLNK
jgi:hypothetical protein